MSEKSTELTIRCACHGPQHTVIFDYDMTDGDLYLTFHLNDGGFWWRLRRGLKYILGFKQRWGHWDEVVVKWEDCKKIQTLLELREKTPSKFVTDVLKEEE